MPSSPQTASLISDTRQFLSALSRDNSRDWFQAHKSQYDTALKAPALVLLDTVAADLERMTTAPVSTKLFRPNRDIRFSKDKTPYHLHLHMMWADTAGPMAFFFGIDLDRVVVGGGVMGFEKDLLPRFRDRVSGPKGADLQHLLQELNTVGWQVSEPELKRTPAPFDKDHKRSDLLRRKSLTVWQEIPVSTTDLPKVLKGRFAGLLGLRTWLGKL